MAWAFATAKRLDDKTLFMALARAAERRLSEFNVQELANTAWAFAAWKRLEAKLLAAMARAAERRLSEFNVQAFVMTLWAYHVCQGVKDAWTLFDHRSRLASHPLCFAALLLHCEQNW